MKAILITQCIQNDFVRLLAPGEPLPNLVHVGGLEASRLLGPHGELGVFLAAAHAAPADELAIVHIADVHDPVRDAAHLDLFRPHCLVGTEGAALAGGIEELSRGRGSTIVVPAGDLNDLVESPLASVLTELCGGSIESLPELRVGVIGVLTDVKVAFLLYELRTRLKARRLATCSALTASRSLAAHFQALESLRAVLDVDVLHSAGSFLDWLLGRDEPADAGKASRDAERDDLFTKLQPAVKGATTSIQPLGGGFSGSQVFLARTAGGATCVMKAGRREELARERFGNERVRTVLGGEVPGLLGFREGPSLAAMAQQLAGEGAAGAAPVTTFKRLHEKSGDDQTTALLETALERTLGGVLGRFYRTAEKENADLLETYGFTDRKRQPRFVEGVKRNALDVARESGFDSPRALLASSGLTRPWLDPDEFYELLPGHALAREVRSSIVHGDLNLANILVAPSGRTWVIDFGRVDRMPVLTDFAKVENDLAYILFKGEGEAAELHALKLQEARISSGGLPAEELLPMARTPAEIRHARLVARLRRIAYEIDPREAAVDDYRVALLRYAAHTLGFSEPSLAQKRLALCAFCQLAALTITRAAPSG